MKQMSVSLFTRSPLHVGCGSAVGVVDLPVLRERVTGLPAIPGTTLKGVLADLFLDQDKDGKWVRSETGLKLFGEDDPKAPAKRGRLLVGECRLTAFPVRSARNGFVWTVSPLTLGRLGISFADALSEEEAVGPEAAAYGEVFVLEEYRLARRGAVPENVLQALSPLCANPLWTDTLTKRLTVLSDTMMAYFAQNACEIAHHNKVDDETGTVADGALFSQENVPSETLFTTVFQADDAGTLECIRKAVNDCGNLIQVGADATTGLGWCEVTFGDIH